MTAESSPTGWSSPSSDRAGSPMFVAAGLFQQLEKFRHTGCPGGAVAPPGTGCSPGPWQRRDGGARGRTGAPCHDSAHGTAESPTPNPMTFRSASNGSRRSRACRRRLPAASEPIATPSSSTLSTDPESFVSTVFPGEVPFTVDRAPRPKPSRAAHTIASICSSVSAPLTAWRIALPRNEDAVADASLM